MDLNLWLTITSTQIFIYPVKISTAKLLATRAASYANMKFSGKIQKPNLVADMVVRVKHFHSDSNEMQTNKYILKDK